jgi:hypothetical protein
MSDTPARLADGLWRWTARHPDWHPGEFGQRVASFALADGPATILIDPLLPEEEEPVWTLLDGLVGERLAILTTIPYHVRDSERVWRRYRGAADVDIWGHRAAAKRLGDAAGFRELSPDGTGPLGVRAFAIGRPRRHEMPLFLPSHRAVAFGDAVVWADGGLRLWAQERVDEARSLWYRERFVPTLSPLLELGVERVLVTHGEPVLHDGTQALAAALAAEPWYHRG